MIWISNNINLYLNKECKMQTYKQVIGHAMKDTPNNNQPKNIDDFN